MVLQRIMIIKSEISDEQFGLVSVGTPRLNTYNFTPSLNNKPAVKAPIVPMFVYVL